MEDDNWHQLKTTRLATSMGKSPMQASINFSVYASFIVWDTKDFFDVYLALIDLFHSDMVTQIWRKARPNHEDLPLELSDLPL